MFSPRGAIVRRMRLTDVETTPDGSRTKLTLTGAGIIVRVRPNAESRRTFNRFCGHNGLVVTACETNAYADGTFNRRTGARVKDAEAAATAFQVIGDGPALLALTGHPCVESWSYALNVRVPVVATGSGEEKPRPPSGTVFGRPATAKATAAALAADTAARVRAFRRATGTD